MTRALEWVRVAASMATVMAMAGCAGVGAAVRADERVRLEPGEALVALRVRSEDFIGGLTFCEQENTNACFDVEGLESRDDVQVMRVPSGRFCLAEVALIRANTGMRASHLTEGVVCFDAAPGVLNDPGRLVISTGGASEVIAGIGYEWEPAGLAAVHAGYPRLAELEVRARLGVVLRR